ncbi:hypothetical protein [Thiobacillus sp.]
MRALLFAPGQIGLFHYPHAPIDDVAHREVSRHDQPHERMGRLFAWAEAESQEMAFLPYVDARHHDFLPDELLKEPYARPFRLYNRRPLPRLRVLPTQPVGAGLFRSGLGHVAGTFMCV